MKRKYVQQGEHNKKSKKSDKKTKSIKTLSKHVETDDVSPSGRRPNVSKDYGNITKSTSLRKSRQKQTGLY